MTDPVEVVVGTIGRAHGLKGEVSVRPRTDYPELRFAAGSRLSLGGRTLIVEGHRWGQGTLLVSFRGVGDRSAAESLRGGELTALVVAEEQPESADEYHDSRLIGLEVRPAGTTRRAGVVTAVHHHPAQDLLVVRTADGDRLVPFVAELVPRVEPADGFVEVVDLPGLLADVDEA